MVDGIVWVWFGLTALSLLFVSLDISSTPESPVLKWGFVLVTAYTGPIGAFLYVLGCREPLPGTHERYVAAHWRQALGSTMHCVAGDGVGILAGAVIASFAQLSAPWKIGLEYLLGFGFGWAVFQALFMRDMAGGSYSRSLASTFLPELLSMNFLMAGMVPVMTIAMRQIPRSHDPSNPSFWFVMSLSLLTGLMLAYPINSWLVAHGLKHGMMTVSTAAANGDHARSSHATAPARHAHHESQSAATRHVAGPGGDDGRHARPYSGASVLVMTMLSFAVLAAGAVIAGALGAM